MAVFYPLYIFCVALVAITTILCITTASKILARRRANRRHRISCKCKACTEKTRKLTVFRSLGVLEPLTLFFIIFTVIVVISAFVGLTSITDSYNPYEVLKVSDKARPNVISSSYSKLSRFAKKNSTKAKELDYARSLLTNSTIRDNYEVYGNPIGLKLVGLGDAYIPASFFNFIEAKIEFIKFFFFMFVVFFGVMFYVVRRLRRSLNRDDLNITIKVYKKLLKESPTTEDVIESLSASSKTNISDTEITTGINRAFFI